MKIAFYDHQKLAEFIKNDPLVLLSDFFFAVSACVSFLFWYNYAQALTAIASSPLRIDIRVILSEILPVLASFLRKNQRALKLSTLALLDTLVKNYSSILRLDFFIKINKLTPF